MAARSFRPSATLMFAMVALVSSSSATRAEAQALDDVNRTYDFNIAAQSLDSALRQFSMITAISILNDSATVSRKKSPAVRGRMTVQQAILALLKGTNLRARFTAGGSIAITPASKVDIMLDQIEAVSRPVVGQVRTDPSWISYADIMQRKIRQSIGRDEKLARGRYSIMLSLWVTPSGRILREEIVRGSGNSDHDERFLNGLKGFDIGEMPPANMPQPIKLEFKVR